VGPSAEGSGLHRLLVQSVVDYAIFALDPTGHILSWNEGAQRIKGYTPEEIVGQHFSIFYPAEEIAAGKPAWELAVATGEGRYEEEGWRLRKDGSRFWANVIITALRDDTGTLVGFAKVTRDLTERRRAEEALRASEERRLADTRRAAEAEAANRIKTEFLATMSHELRTPLNAIGGYTELLALGIHGPVTAEQRTALDRIQRSQRHLLGIITDLLNFSRIEAGHVTYDRVPMAVHDVVDTVLPLLEPQAAAKGITLAHGACPAELVAMADRLKVEQIVLNLLSNAVKFTPAGGRVTLECGGAGDVVAIAVRDTGPGVPTDQLTAIFEPFVQLGRTRSSAHEGTGLGLAISRELARAMGGDLTAESLGEGGSTFTLTLPRR
jgi:PAS domain S-box-containing protein